MKLLHDNTKQGCLALVNELTKGPALFDECGKPTKAVLRHRGSHLDKDEERCVFVGALRLLGCSDREVCALVGCDRRSIPLMLEVAEKTGQIPALKDRLTKLTGANAEQAQIALVHLLERAQGNISVELAAMIKAMTTTAGINTRNLLQLTGSSTEIVPLTVGAGLEEIESWAKANGIDMGPSDYQSAIEGRLPQQNGANVCDDTCCDTPSLVLEAAWPEGAGGCRLLIWWLCPILSHG